MFRRWEFGKGPAYKIGFNFLNIWWSWPAKCFGINAGTRYRIFIQRLAFPDAKPYVRFELHLPNKEMTNHPKCYSFEMRF